MADQNKFEEMLEKLVNEDRAGAEELFHEIVVEKSREIYENLLENDLEEESKDEAVDEASKDEETKESEDEKVEEKTDEEVDESKDEEVDEATDEDVKEDSKDEEAKEGFDMNEFEVEPMPEADPADDMMADLEMGDGEEGDDDGEEASDEDLEDRMVDLEKELDDLRQQFNDEMGGGDDKGDDEDAGDMGDMGDDDEDDAEDESIDLGVEEAKDEEVDEASKDEEVAEKSDAEQMREYVEKVAGGGLDAQKIGGDNGANAKSPVASKNDMGGDASNLVAGGEADSKGTAGGLEGNSPKEDSMGNINVPGGKAAKSMKAQPKGHGAEKKSAGENADNKKSTIGS